MAAITPLGSEGETLPPQHGETSIPFSFKRDLTIAEADTRIVSTEQKARERVEKGHDTKIKMWGKYGDAGAFNNDALNAFKQLHKGGWTALVQRWDEDEGRGAFNKSGIPFRDSQQNTYGAIATREKMAEMDEHVRIKRPDIWKRYHPLAGDEALAAEDFPLGPGAARPDTTTMPHGDRAERFASDLNLELNDDDFKNQGGNFKNTTIYGKRCKQAHDMTRRNRLAIGHVAAEIPAVRRSLHYGQQQLAEEAKRSVEESLCQPTENLESSAGASSSAGPSTQIVPAVPKASTAVVGSGSKTLPIEIRNAMPEVTDLDSHVETRYEDSKVSASVIWCKKQRSDTRTKKHFIFDPHKPKIMAWHNVCKTWFTGCELMRGNAYVLMNGQYARCPDHLVFCCCHTQDNRGAKCCLCRSYATKISKTVGPRTYVHHAISRSNDQKTVTTLLIGVTSATS